MTRRYRFVINNNHLQPRIFLATFNTERDAEEALNLLAFGMAGHGQAHSILLQEEALPGEWRQIKVEFL